MFDIAKINAIIESVLREQQRVPARRLKPDALIATDLGVDGDDAVEFLDELEVRFDINIGDDIRQRFWHESGLFFDKNVQPVSITELASLISKNLTPT